LELALSSICAVIVDPYSSGAMLAEALRARGTKCIAVLGSPDLPKSMRSRFNPGVFQEIIEHDGCYEQTLDAVKRHQPAYVVPGFESGVEFAETLGNDLGLPANGATLRAARRDKFLMAEAVRGFGLRTARQFLSDDIESIVNWTSSTLDWPVIVKPPKSVSSDGVSCCRSADEVRKAAEKILSGTNVLGFRNRSVLAQEFLAGTEYVVDTVSYEGRNKTTAFWQYSRPATAESGEFVCYDAMTLLPYDGERQEVLQSYVFKVLEALDIRYGPAHCELMWVDGEPVLIEAAARLTAGINSILAGICGGICQLDETVEAMLVPDRFLSMLNVQPQLQRRAANVFLMPQRRDRPVRLRSLDGIRRLPTLHSFSVSAQPGDIVKQVAGLVTLVDEDIQSIERDINTIHALESEGVFELEDDFPA
jgi:biotin carboxylase